MRISGITPRGVTALVLLVVANATVWVVTFLTFRGHVNLIELGGVAYLLGLAHALDADHICAIDNVTRKLLQEGQRPALVGFYFSLGHSTIVILVTIAVAAGAATVQSRFNTLVTTGGLIGTLVSAIFLFAIAGMNLLVLRSIVKTFNGIRRGGAYVDHDLTSILTSMGRIGSMVNRLLRLLDRSWKMYVVGFLFGLGFDTATQIGMLGISATAATHGMRPADILVFPLLFTAGMCLVDTADGVLMLYAYGWAFVHPMRKLYYNLMITSVSVLLAFAVGTLEILGLICSKFNLRGAFWDGIDTLNNGRHFGTLGILVICICVLGWIIAIVSYWCVDYRRLALMTGGGTSNR